MLKTFLKEFVITVLFTSTIKLWWPRFHGITDPDPDFMGLTGQSNTLDKCISLITELGPQPVSWGVKRNNIKQTDSIQSKLPTVFLFVFVLKILESYERMSLAILRF